MEADYFYKVQVLQADGWRDVMESEYYESFRAIHKAQMIAERNMQLTRVVKPNGDTVWTAVSEAVLK